ncbi:MAG: hypothetical protein ACRDYA_11190 [Egibacteraceae bacterium]
MPITPTRMFGFDKAMHDALAVYYFPAMDDWDRSIVSPLALQGFHRSMRQDREIYERTASLTAEQEGEWHEYSELGEAVLQHYFEWAAMVDEFDSIFSDQDLWAPIPDPWSPGHELAMPDGRSIRYLGRVDQLISDPDDEYWVVDHRITSHGWEDIDELLLDRMSISCVWALELCYPQLKIAGTIYNELRTDVLGRAGTAGDTTPSTRGDQVSEPERRGERDMAGVRSLNLRRSPATPATGEPVVPAQADRQEGGQRSGDETEIVKQEGNEQFRRTHVRRSRASIENVGVQIALQTVETVGPEIQIYPNPSNKNCPSCAYRKPCIAMSAGFDLGPILATEYRKRSAEEFEEERLRWSSARRGTPAAFGSKAWRPETSR